MQSELKEIQREVGITFVFVTHDQDEALTMSDRIAVFNTGRIAQLGTPSDVYEHPSSPFVAGFVGTSNLLESAASQAVLGRPGTWSVRPEKIRVLAVDESPADGQHAVRGTVREVVYVGMSTRFVVDLEVGGSLTVVQQNSEMTTDLAHLRGQPVQLAWDSRHEYQVAD
jgi:putative spermidine/putrescine transport system ATP-binding protein